MVGVHDPQLRTDLADRRQGPACPLEVALHYDAEKGVDTLNKALARNRPSEVQNGNDYWPVLTCPGTPTGRKS
jgi:hypothetical protein